MATQLAGPYFEGGSGAQRIVEEQERDRLSFEGSAEGRSLERDGVVNQGLELGTGPVGGVEEVLDPPQFGLVRLRNPKPALVS